MKTRIGGLLAAMVTCALVTGCAPIGDDVVPEEMTGDGEAEIILCSDGVPCTSDVLITGVTTSCTSTIMPAGSTCYVGGCVGSCYPPFQTENGLVPGNCGGCMQCGPSPCDLHQCGLHDWCGATVNCGGCAYPKTCLYDDGLYACIL